MGLRLVLIIIACGHVARESKGHRVAGARSYPSTPNCTLYGWSDGAAARLTRLAWGRSCCTGSSTAALASVDTIEPEKARGCLSACRVPGEFWQHAAAATAAGGGMGCCLTSWRISRASSSSPFPTVNGKRVVSHGRCSFWNDIHYDYHGKKTVAGIVSWLLQLECRSYYAQLFPATAVTILQSLKTCNVTVLVFGDGSDAGFKLMEAGTQVLHRWYPSSCGLFVSPDSDAYSEDEATSLSEKYGVVSKPALLLLRRHVGITDVVHVPADSLSSADQLDLHVWSMLQPLRRLSREKFVSDVLTPDQAHVPTLVAFYSCWCENTRQFLEAFVRTSQHMATTNASLEVVRFATLDLTEHQSAVLLLTRYSPTRCPFVLLFYGRREGHRVVDVAYTEVSAHSYPTPATVLDSLSRSVDFARSYRFDALQYSTWGFNLDQVSHLSEGPYGTQCFVTSSNLTDSEPLADGVPPSRSFAEIVTNPEFARLPTHGGIKVVTDDYWHRLMAPLVERNEANSLMTAAGNDTLAVRTVVLIFIRASCASCENSMQAFSEFAKAAENTSAGIPGATEVYLVNCSQTAGLCTRQAVSGYPSLVLIRRIDLTKVGGCLPPKTSGALTYSQIRYHGVLKVSELMHWLSTASAAAVTHVDNFDDHGTRANMEMSGDLSLTATVMPRQERYLPSSRRLGWSYFFPYHCFRLACEILFGPVKCYVKLSAAVPASLYRTDGGVGLFEDSVVTHVSLARSDGFKAALMELQRPLAELLQREELEASTASSSGERSRWPLHTSHRYDLEQTRTCEDDHSLCVDYIVQFTLDHGRLPVTHVTPEMFHTNNGLIGQADLPVLVAFMHPDNFTVGSKFSQALRDVAVSLYKSIRVVTVDVSTYPAWVAQFVPLEERFNLRHDVGSALYRYPRFCLVNWSDHSRAAFYPPLDLPASEHDAHLSVSGLTSFVNKFFTNPASVLITTDSF